MIVAVTGPRTPVYSAGRAGFVLSVWTWPPEFDGPDHDRGAAEPLRRWGLVRVVVAAVVVVEPDERRGDPLVDLVGEVALDDRDHADADREVRGRDDRRREEGDADRDPADARQRRDGHGQDSSSR